MSGNETVVRMTRRGLIGLASASFLVLGQGSSLATPQDPPSLLAGRKLRIVQVMQIAYQAGFVEEEQLTTIVSIAVAESDLFTQARNWHPEKGYRPADQVISVKGPAKVWKNGRQMHSDRGLWQIASYWHHYYSDAVVDDPEQAARIAYLLSNEGKDFSAWTSYNYGRAQKFFDKPHNGWPAIRLLVRRFLKSMKVGPQQLSLSE